MNNLSKEDLEWVEWFYKDIEEQYSRIRKPYTRPTDYIERFKNLLKRNRKSVSNQFEGKKSGGHSNEDH